MRKAQTDVLDSGNMSGTDISRQFEEKFAVKLPEDFKYYLSKYGSGGLGYFDFFGIESGKDIENCSITALMKDCRAKGMPNQLVVIEHLGDYVTCIDVSKNNGEVVTWSWIDDGKICKKADTFEAYFIAKLEDCL